MFKKLFSFIVTVFILNISFLPVFAVDKNITDKKFVIKTQLTSDLDVNKSSENDVVQFITNKSIRDSIGITIPNGTIFNGRITEKEESRLWYKRAKAKIIIEEMILPDGEIYSVDGSTQGKFLKGSAVVNAAKGVAGVPAAIVTGAAGGVVLAAEYISIIGILITGQTQALLGNTIDKLIRGINCKKHTEDTVNLKIKYVDDEFYHDTIFRKTGINIDRNSNESI